MMSNNFLQFIFSTLFSLAVIAYYSLPVALLLFALYPIFIWMTVRSSGTWQKYQKEINQNLDMASGRFAESINQVKVVKSFLRERREMKFFTKHLSKMVSLNRPQSIFWHKQDIKRRLILNAIFFGVYFFVFVQGAQGVLTPGQAVTLILYAMQIRIPIFTISYLVENTQRAVADSRDYFEVMQLDSVEDYSRKSSAVLKGTDIEFSDVRFSYESGRDVLKNFSVKIPQRATVALVGESGQGKTTISNLLLRLYSPVSGTIKIGGKDISKMSLGTLRRSIGVVFQEPALFSGTIAENIGYARANATESEIIAAAKQANAHEFITGFEHGYSSEIGERGLKLSGGQKQRIAIARAILKDAPILILDEATSSLDSRSERLVQQALERLMQGRTTIIIAHRLSTIANVDRIITIKDGAVDECGSPDELRKTNGIYASLLELQQQPDKNNKQLQQYDIVSSV